MKARLNRLTIEIPEPPKSVLGLKDAWEPAPEMAHFLLDHYIEGSAGRGRLHNPDHAHLQEALMGVLWTNMPNKKGGVQVVGQAEMPKSKPGWGGARSEYQMLGWFGVFPQFLITLDARFMAHCFKQGQPARFLALLDHELYHCGQAQDEWGPKFNKDGDVVFTMRPHDVEEFVGVVERWGAGNGAGATAQLVQAAQRGPTIAYSDFDCSCGTCGRKA